VDAGTCDEGDGGVLVEEGVPRGDLQIDPARRQRVVAHTCRDRRVWGIRDGRGGEGPANMPIQVA